MKKRVASSSYIRVEEVTTAVGTDMRFIEEMVRCELIAVENDEGGELVMSREDAERVRVGVLLTTDLEVNLAGVEVILHMREDMLRMQRQFAEVLARLARDSKRMRE